MAWSVFKYEDATESETSYFCPRKQMISKYKVDGWEAEAIKKHLFTENQTNACKYGAKEIEWPWCTDLLV